MDKRCIGIDIGGTTVKMGMFEPDGTLVEKWEKRAAGIFWRILPHRCGKRRQSAAFRCLIFPAQAWGFPAL